MKAPTMQSVPARATADKLVRISRAMTWITTVGMGLIVVLMVAGAFIPSWTRNLLLARLGETGAKLPVTPVEQALAGLIIAVPVGVLVWGLWHVRAMFCDFAQGRVFTATVAHHLQRFGVAALAQTLLGPLTATALALALSLGNPPGQRYLVIAFSINDYLALIVGGVLVAVAAAMREAARLADENAGFV
jgi:hypothetical protein